MTLTATDWTVDRATGNIRYTGDDHGGASPSYATVIEFHRWLQELADDAVATGDDELDITNVNPSQRSTDNIITLINSYNITDAEMEHLFDGSIIQDGGDTIYDGIVNFGNASIQIQIIQDGAVLSDDWWNYGAAGLNPDSTQGISHRFMIKVRANGVDIDGRRIIGTARTFGNTYEEFKIGGGTNRGNNVLALTDADDLNNDTGATTVETWNTITNTEGLRLIDVDNNAVSEEYYSEWNKAAYTINQFYERMKWLTRDGSASSINGLNGELFRGITHSFAYDGETGGSGATNDERAWGTKIDYDNESLGPFVVGEAIHEDTATPVWKGRILALDDNGITGSLIVFIESGTVLDPSSFTGQTSGAKADVNVTPSAVTGGGVMRFFAIDDGGAIGNIYGQLLKGTAPVNDTRMYDDLDVAIYLDVNGSVTERTISTPFMGASTGTAIIGAYGFGVEAADLSANDSVIDLSGSTVNPPTNVTNTVSGLVSGEDRVLVAPWDGTSYDGEGNPSIDKDQLSLAAALTTDNITIVEITETIPSDTPSTGYIRVTDNNGVERRLHYTAWENGTPNKFTIDTTDGNEDFQTVNASIGKDIYIAYLDELAGATTAAYTGVWTTGTRNLVVIVRDGASTPIKEFITSWTFIGSNQTITVIRTTDA